MGSVWRRLGAEVTILEGLPTFLGAIDEQIAKEAQKIFVKQGLKLELGCQSWRDQKEQEECECGLDQCKRRSSDTGSGQLIVSIGRVPNTIGLNAEAVGLKLDERGAICGLMMNAAVAYPGVWAIGDVVRGPMLAHKAEEEGVAVR